MKNLNFISFFVRHPTAANLLMIIMIVAGLISLRQTNTQFFPDFGIDWVSVKVEWPGASAEDIDNNIVQSIEAQVRFLDGIKRVRSTSVQDWQMSQNSSLELIQSTGKCRDGC